MEEEDHESLPVTGSNVMASQSINPIVISRRSNRDELLDEDDQDEVVEAAGILGRLG